jgi:hypothetical protein
LENIAQFGLLPATRQYEARIKSNDEQEGYRENKSILFTYRPSPQKNEF